MSERKYKKEDCLLLLKQKHLELQSQGLIRYPQRSDFTDREVVAIKAFLGPWPRALEEAEIKPPRNDKKQKRKENRIRSDCSIISDLKQHEDTDV